jgi:hypothetical protein
VQVGSPEIHVTERSACELSTLWDGLFTLSWGADFHLAPILAVASSDDERSCGDDPSRESFQRSPFAGNSSDRTLGLCVRIEAT